MPTTLRLPSDIEERYSSLAKRTDRTKSYYLRRAVEESIDRFEEEAAEISTLQEIVEQWRAGKRQTYTLDEVRERLGLDS